MEISKAIQTVEKRKIVCCLGIAKLQLYTFNYSFTTLRHGKYIKFQKHLASKPLFTCTKKYSWGKAYLVDCSDAWAAWRHCSFYWRQSWVLYINISGEEERVRCFSLKDTNLCVVDQYCFETDCRSKSNERRRIRAKTFSKENDKMHRQPVKSFFLSIFRNDKSVNWHHTS